MSNGFQIFAQVHRVMKTQLRLQRVVQEILEDFESDNCVYLELRTTPKPLDNINKHEYIQTIEKVIKDYKGKMQTRLIVSVNRAQSVEEAWENLEIAKNSEICVGMDFSGNPAVNKFRDFEEVFREARNSGLKVTVHTAEIQDDEDTDHILEFKPDRLGHCNYLTEAHEEKIRSLGIPIEICVSSNITTLDIQLDSHHFIKFFRFGHPLALCTDDTLLFDTSLTQEFSMVAKQFDITMEDLLEITKTSARIAFSSQASELVNSYIINKLDS